MIEPKTKQQFTTLLTKVSNKKITCNLDSQSDYVIELDRFLSNLNSEFKESMYYFLKQEILNFIIMEWANNQEVNILNVFCKYCFKPKNINFDFVFNCARINNVITLFEYLKKCGAKFEIAKSHFFISYVFTYGDYEFTNYIIDNNIIDTNYIDYDEILFEKILKPLCKYGSTFTVKKLIEAGYEINHPDNSEMYESFEWACKNKHFEILDILIDNEFNIEEFG